MNIYLIGFMGSGKSGLGRKLSGLAGMPFTDLDEVFEHRYHIGISDFFEKYGEANFRKIERDLLLETGNMENTVISTGGGTPCFFDNMEFIRKHGVSVYLRMSASELSARLGHVRKKRPLLKDIPAGSLEEWISKQLNIREVYYMQADHIFHPLEDDPDELLLRLR